MAIIVIFYTFFGGYLAVSITDFFQGVIMLIAMVMVPIVALLKLNGWDTFHDIAQMKPTNSVSYTHLTLPTSDLV